MENLCLPDQADPLPAPAPSTSAASLVLTPSPSPPSLTSALHTLNLAMCSGIGDGRGLRAMLRGCRDGAGLGPTAYSLQGGANLNQKCTRKGKIGQAKFGIQFSDSLL